MVDRLKIAIAQLNLVVGDIEGNKNEIIKQAKYARFHLGADIVVFPELCLTAYPPEDLLLKPIFLEHVDKALKEIINDVKDVDVVLGYPERDGDALYNSAIVIRDREIKANYRKHCLPNYDVFDEKRYFKAGSEASVFELKGVKLALSVCEDIWFPEPARLAKQAGASVLININASPFHYKKSQERINKVRQRVEENNIAVVYVNLVGGQDELVFDGDSFVMNADGEVCNRAMPFHEGVHLVECTIENGKVSPIADKPQREPSHIETVYRALVLGIRDYIEKNNFPGAIVGVSGGIDSALTLALAVDAIGAERVEAVMMPSRYTSDMSKEGARIEAERLGVTYSEISIESIYKNTLDVLEPAFAGYETDSTEENIQARIRGMILMALSNKKSKLVLTTGNKSEMAVGYATLYGDMAGGFNALKDVPKTMVYQLAEFRNTRSPHEVIPQQVIHRAPTAELAANQKDTDNLPDYGELDGILNLYVEQNCSIQEIIKQGYNRVTVERVVNMVERNEYKRRQAAPGVRITRKAFSRDRRYPITSRYTE